MRWPRIRLWMLTVLVALVALAIGGVQHWRQSAKYRELAQREKALADNARASLPYLQKNLNDCLHYLALRYGSHGRIKAILKDPRAARCFRNPNEAMQAFGLSQDAIVIEENVALYVGYIAGAEWRIRHHGQRCETFLRCARYPWLASTNDPNLK